jgi:hypothetical protein
MIDQNATKLFMYEFKGRQAFRTNDVGNPVIYLRIFHKVIYLTNNPWSNSSTFSL